MLGRLSCGILLRAVGEIKVSVGTTGCEEGGSFYSRELEQLDNEPAHSWG